ncbi:hypothetical protein VTO42DRAFT_2596 [Malbranchea cinnamomea]
MPMVSVLTFPFPAFSLALDRTPAVLFAISLDVALILLRLSTQSFLCISERSLRYPAYIHVHIRKIPDPLLAGVHILYYGRSCIVPFVLVLMQAYSPVIGIKRHSSAVRPARDSIAQTTSCLSIPSVFTAAISSSSIQYVCPEWKAGSSRLTKPIQGSLLSHDLSSSTTRCFRRATVETRPSLPLSSPLCPVSLHKAYRGNLDAAPASSGVLAIESMCSLR